MHLRFCASSVLLLSLKPAPKCIHVGQCAVYLNSVCTVFAIGRACNCAAISRCLRLPYKDLLAMELVCTCVSARLSFLSTSPRRLSKCSFYPSAVPAMLLSLEVVMDTIQYTGCTSEVLHVYQLCDQCICVEACVHMRFCASSVFFHRSLHESAFE